MTRNLAVERNDESVGTCSGVDTGTLAYDAVGSRPADYWFDAFGSILVSVFCVCGKELNMSGDGVDALRTAGRDKL